MWWVFFQPPVLYGLEILKSHLDVVLSKQFLVASSLSWVQTKKTKERQWGNFILVILILSRSLSNIWIISFEGIEDAKKNTSYWNFFWGTKPQNWTHNKTKTKLDEARLGKKNTPKNPQSSSKTYMEYWNTKNLYLWLENYQFQFLTATKPKWCLLDKFILFSLLLRTIHFHIIIFNLDQWSITLQHNFSYVMQQLAGSKYFHVIYISFLQIKNSRILFLHLYFSVLFKKQDDISLRAIIPRRRKNDRKEFYVYLTYA